MSTPAATLVQLYGGPADGSSIEVDDSTSTKEVRYEGIVTTYAANAPWSSRLKKPVFTPLNFPAPIL